MNKVLLLTAAVLLILMTMTSPAQIRHLFDTGAPLAVAVWLSPLLIFAGIYYLIKHPSSNQIDNIGIGLVGMKGGSADSDFQEKKEELKIVDNKIVNGFRYKIFEIKQSNK